MTGLFARQLQVPLMLTAIDQTSMDKGVRWWSGRRRRSRTRFPFRMQLHPCRRLMTLSSVAGTHC